MIDLCEKIDEAVKSIRHHTDLVPRFGITLGSGISGFIEGLNETVEVDYSDIPNFPVSTVPGHKGALVFGKIEGVPVAVMQGRAHYYEGYLLQTITLPVRVFKELGAQIFIVTNAAGGLNEKFSVGDIMLIKDHINQTAGNPLIGKNDDDLGPRFPDMSEAYDLRLRESAEQAAKELGMKLKSGVYAGVTGPSYETPAELDFLRIIGADAVGMSTVPEVIVARHAGLRVLGFSIITDLSLPSKCLPITHEEVLIQTSKAGPILAKLITKTIKEFS